MRSDMAKVVTEAPRRGHANPSRKWGRRLRKDDANWTTMVPGTCRQRVAAVSKTRRTSPTCSGRCADICVNRLGVPGTRSGRRSRRISTAAP